MNILSDRFLLNADYAYMDVAYLIRNLIFVFAR